MSEQLAFEPLTPTSFLARSAVVHGERLAVVDGGLELTYRELSGRAARLAGALDGLGVQEGGRVAVLAPNSHLMLEAHYGVPLARAVLVALNMRLSAGELGYILESAHRLMAASVNGARPLRRVYRRAGRACRRCGTPIRARAQGDGARIAYWCPTCQRDERGGGEPAT